ncbi:MAG: hypothetical protein NTZ13_03780 [Candidatus Parcubacteria bacterium]|nr:hypothetical protein [Candidatus Parcubacteria bacterium]
MKLREGTIRMLKNILDRISLALSLFLTLLICFLVFGKFNWTIITALSLFIVLLIAVQAAIFMTLHYQ